LDVYVQVNPTGPLANLKKLLFSTDNVVAQWLSVYWFIPAASVTCVLTLAVVRHSYVIVSHFVTVVAFRV